jgi:tRNA G18 (ribose-2'-O)-methylase SpoU
MNFWTPSKFLSLPQKQRHKKASELLRELFLGNVSIRQEYEKLCEFMGISFLESLEHEAISQRFHYHLKESGVNWQEHNLLHIRTQDSPSEAPFLPIAIYLDDLRSAFNVGNILRTTEAFRLGKVFFSSATPFIDNPKVQKTSMGVINQLSCEVNTDIQSLPRPFIALETAEDAPIIHQFSFPKKFTLFLGNEEYGLSQKILQSCDNYLQIPLQGSKNSLNVASAFAIAAAEIRRQFPLQ